MGRLRGSAPTGLVEQQDKRIEDLRCQGDVMAIFDLSEWQRLGLAQDRRERQWP